MVVKKTTSATRKDTPAKKAAPAKAASARKAAVRTSATKKAAAPRATARNAGPRSPADTTAGRTSAAKKTVAKKAVAGKAGLPVTAARKAAASGTAAREAAPPKTAVKAGAGPQRLRVRENEKPWTTVELATVRADLEADIERLQREISVAELNLVDLMRDAGEGSGDDQADAGTATFEREQEISLANNARGVFEQSARALARLVDGSYGVCESCGSPIGKNRLLAFPRATLCMTCKSKQERR